MMDQIPEPLYSVVLAAERKMGVLQMALVPQLEGPLVFVAAAEAYQASFVAAAEAYQVSFVAVAEAYQASFVVEERLEDEQMVVPCQALLDQAFPSQQLEVALHQEPVFPFGVS